MIELESQLINETIKVFYNKLPYGGTLESPNWDEMSIYDSLEKKLIDLGIVERWGDHRMLILTATGIQVVEKHNSDINKYIQYKEDLARKEEEEHQLEIDALRSNIKYNERQTRFSIFNLCFLIANIILSIFTIFFASSFSK